MAKTTPNKTKTPTKKALLEEQVKILMASHPDLSKKDAEFITNTLANIIPYVRRYIEPILECLTKYEGQSDEDYEKRKHNSAIKQLMCRVLLSLGSFMCHNKDFLANSKARTREVGKEMYANYLFKDYILTTFYFESGIADTIEACCYAKLNPPHAPKNGKGKKK